MRHYHPKLKQRPPSRLDSSRPVKDAGAVAERGLKRLATAIKDVRERLGMTQSEFAAACDLGVPTIQRVEAGTVSPRTKTFTGLDKGARWPAGTARRIVEDGTPPPATVETPTTPAHEWSAAERKRMQEMPMAEVQETFEVFRSRSEFLADVWLREVMRVKAEAENAQEAATDS